MTVGWSTAEQVRPSQGTSDPCGGDLETPQFRAPLGTLDDPAGYPVALSKQVLVLHLTMNLYGYARQAL